MSKSRWGGVDSHCIRLFGACQYSGTVSDGRESIQLHDSDPLRRRTVLLSLAGLPVTHPQRNSARLRYLQVCLTWGRKVNVDTTGVRLAFYSICSVFPRTGPQRIRTLSLFLMGFSLLSDSDFQSTKTFSFRKSQPILIKPWRQIGDNIADFLPCRILKLSPN